MYVPDHFKTQEMCDKAIKDDSSFLQLLSNWFITKEWIDMWYDDYDDNGDHWDDDVDYWYGDHCDDGGDYWDDDKDTFFEWYDGYRKPKAQKTSIKEELLLIAWHPLRY